MGECIGCGTHKSIAKDWDVTVLGKEIQIGLCSKCLRDAAQEMIDDAVKEAVEQTEVRMRDE